MNRLVCLVALVLTATITNAAAQATYIPKEGHWMCESDPTMPTVYMSAAFYGNVSVHDVAVAFRQWLKATYGYEGSVPCEFVTRNMALATVQANWKQKGEGLRKMGRTVVETGWVFEPKAAATAPQQPAAPPAAAPAAASSVQAADGSGAQHLYQCESYLLRARTRYFSLVRTTADQRVLLAAWTKYVSETHPSPPAQGARCFVVVGTLEQAHAQIAQETGLKSIDEGWSYKP